MSVTRHAPAGETARTESSRAASSESLPLGPPHPSSSPFLPSLLWEASTSPPSIPSSLPPPGCDCSSTEQPRWAGGSVPCRPFPRVPSFASEWLRGRGTLALGDKGLGVGPRLTPRHPSLPSSLMGPPGQPPLTAIPEPPLCPGHRACVFPSPSVSFCASHSLSPALLNWGKPQF